MTPRRQMTPTLLLVLLWFFLATVSQSHAAPPQPQAVTFSADELLGRPTNTSITINVVPDDDIELYYEYGTVSGEYGAPTPIMTATDSQPHETVIDGLQPDTEYFYRMRYRAPGGDWVARSEHAFRTQRAPGSTFTFTVLADSHLFMTLGDFRVYQQTLLNVAADSPDFHLDLGDTFAMDGVTSAAGARQTYLVQRSYMDTISPGTPIFLAVGNHEQEEGWHLDDVGNPAMSKPVLGTNARKLYYPNPIPDSFYSGNTDTYDALDGDQLHEDYYAWEWGDALFVVLDPFWYSTTKPFVGNTGGGEDSDVGSGDRWDWTLGLKQFQWFKQTIADSKASYKFVFAHHIAGGLDDYGRGGAGAAHLVEWGGYGEDGITWEFDSRRPRDLVNPENDWGGVPIHQLMIDNGVSAFFHGHDHQYAYEKRDGIVYQALPSGGISGNGFGIYSESDPYTIKVLPNSGHLRITVSPDVATVAYVRSDIAAGGINGVVSHSYTIEPFPGPTITITGTPVASFSSAPGLPSAEQSYTVSGSHLVADIEIVAPLDFEISTTGSGFGPSLTLPQSGGSVAETTVFVRFHRATEGTSSGDVTHTSPGAATQAVAVSGTTGAIGYVGDIGTAAIKDGDSDLLAITTTAAVAAGDDIVIAYATDPAENLQVSVTDSAGNTYVEAGHADRIDHLGTTIFVATNVTALSSGGTITITQDSYTTAAPVARAAVASVFRGLADLDALDRSNTGVGDGSSDPSSGSTGTTRAAEELLIGAIGAEGPDGDATGKWANAFSAGPRLGTTGDADDTNVTAALGWRIATATGAYAAQKSDTTPRDWAAVIATFMTRPVCTVTPPQAVEVSIAHDAADVILTWQNVPASSGGYQVHRSPVPYFLPDESTRLGDPLPATTTIYTDTGAAGTAGTSYTYIVQALNCDGSLVANSTARAIFNLPLVPGAP